MAQHYDFYKSLDLTASSSTEEIRNTLNSRLNELHTNNVPATDGKVQEIQAALLVLGNESRRNKYDARLSDENAPAMTISALRTLAHTGSFPDEQDSSNDFSQFSQPPAAAPAPAAPKPPRPILPFLPKTITMPIHTKVMVYVLLGIFALSVIFSLISLLVSSAASDAFLGPISVAIASSLVVFEAIAGVFAVSLALFASEHRAKISPIAITSNTVLMCIASLFFVILYRGNTESLICMLVNTLGFLAVAILAQLKPSRDWYAGIDAADQAKSAPQPQHVQHTQQQSPQQPFNNPSFDN